MEKWKDIKNYEGIYQVSNLGNIKSLDRISEHGYKYKGKLLKLSPSKNGYLYVGLSIKGKTKMFPVHRIVIESFLGFSKLYCDHIDNNKHNNCISNLKYVTHRQNMSKFHKTYKSLPTGVHKTKYNTYIASIRDLNNNKIALGSFKTIEEAEIVYNNKLKQIQNEK